MEPVNKLHNILTTPDKYGNILEPSRLTILEGSPEKPRLIFYKKNDEMMFCSAKLSQIKNGGFDVNFISVRDHDEKEDTTIVEIGFIYKGY